MNSTKRPFSNLKFGGWRNLLYFVIICFYCVVFFASLLYGSLGGDYLQYWIAGKIADVKGYSEVYNLSELRSVQGQILVESGDIEKENDTSFAPLPLGYFSVFIIPFQFLSRFSIENGYILWTILNLGLLIGYLVFFLRKTIPGNETKIPDLKLLLPFLISYAVFFNITCGQVEVFVLICAGEFVRQAGNNKPILSGLWLGGLLLKPPLLILIIPIFIIMRYWKVLLGFFASSGMILGTSLLLSGLDGMRELINIWTKVTGVTAPTAPEIMINWRMVGVNLNNLLNTSLGWIITGLGMVLTIMAVFYLIRHIPPYGSPFWVMTILGVFTATLAITWHSHYHMAMVLIPFLVYALVNKLLPEKIILLWGITAPIVFLGTLIIEVFFFGLLRINPIYVHMIAIAFTGLISNILLLITILHKNRELPLSKRLSIVSKS